MQAVGVQRRAERQLQRDRAASAAESGRRARERSSRGVAAKTSRTVALNWRTLREARGEGDVDHRELRGLEQQRGRSARGARGRGRAGRRPPPPPAAGAGGARCSRAGGARPPTPVAIDDAVGDQPHRAADQVGAAIPLRRARRGVRADSACRPGSPPPAQPPRSSRSARSRASACGPGSSGRQ